LHLRCHCFLRRGGRNTLLTRRGGFATGGASLLGERGFPTSGAALLCERGLPTGTAALLGERCFSASGLPFSCTDGFSRRGSSLPRFRRFLRCHDRLASLWIRCPA
jgi:hypothetical protein